MRTLGFDDQNEAAQFCQFFGLTTDESCVTLDKAMFIEPEENWCPRRSALIEQKRTTSIGEVSSHVTCHIRCSIQLGFCFLCFTCTSTCLTVTNIYVAHAEIYLFLIWILKSGLKVRFKIAAELLLYSRKRME